MKNALIAALAITLLSGGGMVLSFIDDPTFTPVRSTAIALMVTAIGLAWGRVIWVARHN